jgi:MFS family permease
MGQLIAPPVVSRLISTYGWRLSYIILGIVTLLVLLLASQFLRRAPSQAGELLPGENEGGGPRPELENEGYSLREAVSTRQFWLVNGVFFCFGFTLLAVEVHIVPHAIELGIPAISAANVLATIGGMTVVGNFVLGYVGDRIGNRQLYIIGFIVWAVAFLWLVPAREMWMLYVFTVLFGFTRGGMVPSESPLVARVFGLSSHGLILGVVGLGFTSGAAIGPFLTGYIFDVTGSYQMAFPVCAVVSIIGLTLAATLTPTKKLGTKL